MRRPIFLLLACILALATGLALLGLGAVAVAPPGEAARAQANEAVVRRFYAAVNAHLRTGYAAPLDGLVAVGLAEHPARPGLPPGRDGLIRALAALRAAHPALQLGVEDLRGAGDQVLARVRVEGAPPDGASPWGEIDVFRLADGRIAEHWGISPAPVAEPPLRHQVALERRTYHSGADYPLEAAGAVVLAPEVGRLALRIALPPGEPLAAILAANPTVIAPGDLFVLPQGAAATARVWGPGPVVVLALTLVASGSAGATTSTPRAIGPERITLAAGEERVTLAAGAPRPPHAVARPEVVLVEEGVLSLEVAGPTAWARTVGLPTVLRQGVVGVPGVEANGLVAAGDGALVPAGSSVAWRNAGNAPLRVLVVTIPDPGRPAVATVTKTTPGPV